MTLSDRVTDNTLTGARFASFSPNSPPNLRPALRCENLPPRRITRTGRPDCSLIYSSR